MLAPCGNEHCRELTAAANHFCALMGEQLKLLAAAYYHSMIPRYQYEMISQPILHPCKGINCAMVHQDMWERNSQTPSTRQTPFEARLKKALRLSSVPVIIQSSPRTGYRKLYKRADSYRRDFRRGSDCGPGGVESIEEPMACVRILGPFRVSRYVVVEL